MPSLVKNQNDSGLTSEDDQSKSKGFSLGGNATTAGQRNGPEVQRVSLTIYSDGYMFDFEKEARLFSDANNTQIFEVLQRGETPPFLASKFPGQKIDLVIKDEKTQSCPKVKGFKLF